LAALEIYIHSAAILSLRTSLLSYNQNPNISIMSAGTIDPKLIESIPPAVVKTLPAGQPPPGVKPNFTHPATRVPIVLAVGIAFVALAVVCFSIRIYTKLTMRKKWKWDDGEWHWGKPSVQPDHKLTAVTSDLLFGFRKPIWFWRRSIHLSNTTVQMCSIVYFVAIVMGEWLCCSTPADEANRS